MSPVSGLVELRKQAALLVTIITIIALTVTLNTSNVYAVATVSVSPNPINPGTPVTLTGSGYPANTLIGSTIFNDNTGNCFGTQFVFQTVKTDGTGAFTLAFSTVGLTVGTHCMDAVIDQTVATTILTVTSAAIPEYPLGLPILAIFMILAYGVIRRRTRN